MYFVSRQMYWGVPPKQGTVVEIVSGGRDYANPNMLVEKFKHLGEGQEFEDPREAVEAAVKVLKAWRAAGEKNARIAYGSTGGGTLPFEPTTIREAQKWADKTYEKLPKCDGCGGVLPANKRDRYKLGDPYDYAGEEFCSSSCADRAYEFHEEEDRKFRESEEGGGGARHRQCRPHRGGGGAQTSAAYKHADALREELKRKGKIRVTDGKKPFYILCKKRPNGTIAGCTVSKDGVHPDPNQTHTWWSLSEMWNLLWRVKRA